MSSKNGTSPSCGKHALAAAEAALDDARRLLEKLPCPSCGHVKSKVIETSPFTKREGVFRRRECVACRHRFTTEEVIKPVCRSGARKLPCV